MGSEYGWNKDDIFALYPAEIHILERKIEQRKARDDDYELLRLLIAARAPLTKDVGTALMKQIQARWQEIDMGEGVTPESRKRDLARFRKKLERLANKK